jgi:hypothetical protein
MLARLAQFLLLSSMISLGFVCAHAQRGADNKPSFVGRCQEIDLSRFEKETCEKMRIAQEQKDHDAMLKRGEEVQRLSERLVRSYELNGKLSSDDRNLLESLEKNVKKIRDELGGDGDGEEIDDVIGPDKKPNLENAVDKLKTITANLVDDLKKTTRFSISATAIQSSNAVLAVARFLRIRK